MKDADFEKLVELKHQELAIQQQIVQSQQRIIKILQNSHLSNINNQITKL